MRLRLLVTGFGPYPGVHRNPTAALARRIARDPRLTRLGIDARAVVLETSYAGAGKALPAIVAEFRPDACLHLGLAPRSWRVRVEVRAENRARRLAPDAKGGLPRRRVLVEAGSPTLRTMVDTAALLAALRRAGLDAAISRDAGAYLCNAVYYWSLLAGTATASPRPVVFVHLPRPAPAPGSRPRGRGRRARPTMASLERGLLAAALRLAAEAERERLRRAAPPA